MAKLDCQKKLSKLDERREAVLTAVNALAQYGKAVSDAMERAGKNKKDESLFSKLNDSLTSFVGAWSEADAALKSWETDARKFRQEVLAPIVEKTKRDKTQKELATACVPLVHYIEAAEPEIKALRGLLDMWWGFHTSVVTITDEWYGTALRY